MSENSSARRAATRGRAPRSLADELRGWDDDRLARLLRHRPDLAVPSAADLTSLAARATTRASVQRLLDRIDTPTLRLLEVAAALPEPVRRTDIGRLLGVSATRAGTLVSAARDLALLWGTDTDLHVVRTAADLLGPHPAGLGPALTGPLEADLADLIGQAPAAARDLLAQLTWGPPVGSVGRADRRADRDSQAPLDWLLARGLLAVQDPMHVVLPLEVAVHLRGGRVYADDATRAPLPSTHQPVGGSVDEAAGAAASDLLRLVSELADLWGLNPPPLLRSGGVGMRELRRVAGALDVDDTIAAFVVELAWATGLVADDDAVGPSWAPTPAYDRWTELDPGERWEHLARAWLGSTRAPGLVGSRDDHGTVRGALSPSLDRSLAPSVRLDALTALAEAEPGSTVDLPGLLSLLHWRRPRRTRGFRGALYDELVRWTLREADLLGVTSSGALSSAGRALVDGCTMHDGPGLGSAGGRSVASRSVAGNSAGRTPVGGGPASDGSVDGRAADGTATVGASVARPSARRRTGSATSAPTDPAEVMADWMPAPVDHLLLQADLTAIAPGPLTPDLARLMSLLAEVESRGGATVYRFGPDSLRRALDAGWSAGDLLDQLTRHSRTPVPQPLEYLVNDVARRHGRLRVGAASSYLTSDDPALLEQVLADRRVRTLRLRRLAPTVLAAQAEPTVVLTTLREAGLAPAAESPTGEVVVRRPDLYRTPEREPPRPSTVDPPLPPHDHLVAQVRALRAGQRAADEDAERALSRPGPRLPVTDPSVTLAALRDAAATRQRVWIGYTDQAGQPERRVVEPLSVDGGRVTAFDQGTAQVREFSVHRITGVAAATSDPA